jgi:nitrogen regulatory protein PII
MLIVGAVRAAQRTQEALHGLGHKAMTIHRRLGYGKGRARGRQQQMLAAVTKKLMTITACMTAT